MTWISKFDTTFIIYADRIYKKRFVNYDNLSYWLFYEKNKGNEKDYYLELEDLFRNYCNWQTKKVKEYREIE